MRLKVQLYICATRDHKFTVRHLTSTSSFLPSSKACVFSANTFTLARSPRSSCKTCTLNCLPAQLHIRSVPSFGLQLVQTGTDFDSEDWTVSAISTGGPPSSRLRALRAASDFWMFRLPIITQASRFASSLTVSKPIPALPVSNRSAEHFAITVGGPQCVNC